ncbi:MAG: LuxR C-terminal-related transcriptional regulator [Solirubrobacteraceae bacterium]
MLTRQPVSVLLVRFEDIVGLGLRALIEEDENLVLVACDVAHSQLTRTLDQHRPQVALLNFGSLSTAAELRDLHASSPDTRLLVLANRPSAAECRQLLAFGATGCLAKSTEARDVLHAIHLASRGLHILPPTIAPSYQPNGPDTLTSREADVLELLQSGRSNAEIAQQLQISVETVRTHARRVYRKLGVRTRRELHRR